MQSMTRRFSISLPDDVAEQLDRVENASAYIAETLRHRIRRERVQQMLKDHGYRLTDEGVARMRVRVYEQEAKLREYLARQPKEDGR